VNLLSLVFLHESFCLGVAQFLCFLKVGQPVCLVAFKTLCKAEKQIPVAQRTVKLYAGFGCFDSIVKKSETYLERCFLGDIQCAFRILFYCFVHVVYGLLIHMAVHFDKCPYIVETVGELRAFVRG